MTPVRRNIQKMTGYTPGEQPDDTDVVKLNTNENPYPPSAGTMDALRAVTAEQLRRYPNPTARPFRELAAGVHGVGPDNIIAVNGGDELLRLAITTFVETGGVIGIAEPSYSLYPVLAAIHDCGVHRVELGNDWGLPDDLADRMNDAGASLVILVNPHAPSGRLTSAAALDRIAARLDGVLLVDEAYVDFADPDIGHDTVALVRGHENVMLLRTLSKGYSLAGLRFGYGIADASLIDPMQTKTKDSYNTDVLSQALAVAALGDRDAAAETWRAVRAERDRLTGELASLGLSCAPSQSNFLLATVPGGFGGGAAGVYESLKRRSVFVRYFDQPRLNDKLRITVGTPDENNALLSALRDIASS